MLLESRVRHSAEHGRRQRPDFVPHVFGRRRVPSRDQAACAISAMIHMSSRASPGGSSAFRTRCTRRSLLVTVPSASHQLDDAGSTTSANSAVAVRKIRPAPRGVRALR